MQASISHKISQKACQPLRRSNRVSLKVNSQFQLRPYTVRKGDTLSSIAKKRDLTLEQIQSLNPKLSNPEALEEGQTLLIPADKLSERDREIISGLQSGQFRLYPVREGETIENIILKRGITMDEVEQLNPTLDLSTVQANTVIKLPSGKYTVREREMLFAAGAPREFLDNIEVKWGLVYGGIALLVFVFFWLRKKTPDDD